jgi:hypothetical protein
MTFRTPNRTATMPAMFFSWEMKFGSRAIIAQLEENSTAIIIHAEV